MRENLQTKHYTIVSLFFAAASLGLYFFFPTTLFFDEVVSFLVFIIVLPMLYMSIILHKPCKEYFVFPHNTLQLLGIGALVGLITGITMGLIVTLTKLVPSYTENLLLYENHFWVFLFSEFFFVLPSIFGSVFFGHVFVRTLLARYQAAWIIGGLTITLLFLTGGTPFLFILFPLTIIPILQTIQKTHFLSLTTALFIALLIFDTFIITSFL